jgi:hypothetical protein
VIQFISASGPSRHFAATQRFGRFRTGADIRWQAGPTGSVENDPIRTFGVAHHRCSGRHAGRAQGAIVLPFEWLGLDKCGAKFSLCLAVRRRGARCARRKVARSAASDFGRISELNVAVPVANQIRTYWWCSPPRIGRQRMSPASSTAREIGASFSKDKCVRISL